VYGAILPKRPKESAEAYATVWTDKGSPLVSSTQELVDLVQAKTSVPIRMAMRYQNPSIESVLVQLKSEYPDLSELFLIPLYPHYAMSSTATSVQKVQEVVQKKLPGVSVKVQPPFYQDPEYLEALTQSIQPYLQTPYDHFLLSYHGLPERHLRKTDPTGCHCLKVEKCCQVPSPAHETCYRAQVYTTSRLMMEKLGVQNYSVSFQSRLGRDPWLRPYTDQVVVELAQNGVKHLKVACPAFVTDCLETLEEIGERAKHDFLSAGGESFEMIPCLNTHPAWVKTLLGWIEEFT
jgi:ferrochelatase